MFIIKLQDEGKLVPKRVQLLRVGEFNYSGDTLKISKETLLSLKENFDANVLKYEDGKLPLDYFHDSDKIAAGWIEGVELSSDNSELWIDVKWTTGAESKIAEGELRYLSAEFALEYQLNEGSKKFGPTLLGAGLTNRPFVKGMKPVKQFSEKGNQMTLEQAVAKIAELEKMIQDMKDMESADKAELSAMKEKAIEDAKKASEVAALAEKNTSFDKMLSDKKVVEAQREHFIKGDVIKFAELSKPLNDGKGTSGEGAPITGKTAQDQIIELAEKLVTEKKISLSTAISSVLSSDPELKAKYEKETSVR